MLCFANKGMAGLELTASATNEIFSADEYEDQENIAMGDIHEGIFDIHQSSRRSDSSRRKLFEQVIPK